MSKTTIGQIWKDFGLKPHRVDHFKLSTDPLFIDKLYDVVGLYLNPPEAAVVLCVDEKSQVQALQRSQPAFPMMPGMPERRTHDYVRHGTTTLFAAMNVADGTVISSLHRRHRATEFKKFLTKIDDRGPRRSRHPPDLRQLRHPQAPHHQDLARRPPPSARCISPRPTPPGSNLVERFFGYVTADLLQRSDHRSVQALEADIRAWVKAWNDDPKTFVWTKTAEQILASLGRLMQRISSSGH